MQTSTTTLNYVPLCRSRRSLEASDAICLEELGPFAGETKKSHSIPSSVIDGQRTGAIKSGSDISIQQSHGGARKKRYSLDENPVPLDYDDDVRGRWSLDRAYDRTSRDFELILSEPEATLDHVRPKKLREPSYTLRRYLQTDDLQPPASPKVTGLYSLLSLLGVDHNPNAMIDKFLELSSSTEMCTALRQADCIPLLVQQIHSDADDLSRINAIKALRNVVTQNCDEKSAKREYKILRYIEQLIEYTVRLRAILDNGEAMADDFDQHPMQVMSSLMTASFDAEHRETMSLLGAVQAIAHVVRNDHAVHGTQFTDAKCTLFRRYATMALTNLTYGHEGNKQLLCANRDFLSMLVDQIDADSEELVQATANVLRNLAWHSNEEVKSTFNQLHTVTALIKAGMRSTNENSIRAILSALWNFSTYSGNKTELCAVDGALAFLVDMLTYDENSQGSMAIIENAGGILANTSANIARSEQYRQVLREKNCLGILLQQLRSASLTVVNNACQALWNLSARCPIDQQFLWDHGAVPMLRSLQQSKHKMIAKGSCAALRNLLNFKPAEICRSRLDPVARMMGLKELPSLNVRKQKAMLQELELACAATKGVRRTAPVQEYQQSSHQVKHQALRKPQEADGDQPVNFSLLYVENHVEDRKPQRGEAFGSTDDTVKCYEIEGTPGHSSATSTVDLRDVASEVSFANKSDTNGVETPEKPVQFCEEGTPSCRSANASFSSIDSGDESHATQAQTTAADKNEDTQKTASQTNSASEPFETPLVFSRRSSLGSLGSVEPHTAKDGNSEVISEVRLVSGGAIHTQKKL